MNTIRLSPAHLRVEILHEDDVILALNKPAGLLAVPDRFDKTRPNLISLLQAARSGAVVAPPTAIDVDVNVHPEGDSLLATAQAIS